MNVERNLQDFDTIKNTLQTDIDDILKQLVTPTLYSIIREGCYISGGAIASLRLGEKVNDYDVYCKDLVTAHTVLNHLIKVHNSCLSSTCHHINVSIDDNKFVLKRSNGESIQTEKDSCSPYYITKNAVSTVVNGKKIQFIYMQYGEKCYENFDFVHTKGVYDFNNKTLTIPTETLNAIDNKILITSSYKTPLRTYFRVLKFVSRGWKMPFVESIKLLEQIQNININDDVIYEIALEGQYSGDFFSDMEEVLIF